MRRFRARAKKAKGVAMEAQNLAKAVNVRDKMRATERDALIRKIIMKVNFCDYTKNGEMRSTERVLLFSRLETPNNGVRRTAA